jgi:hypothetical protein
MKRQRESRSPADLFRRSGREDSNLRLPAPKAGALTGLSYAPMKNPKITPIAVVYLSLATQEPVSNGVSIRWQRNFLVSAHAIP